MKNCVFTLFWLIVTHFSYCQWDAKKYQDFWDKGDSLYNAKDYKNSALAYSSALSISAANISLWERWIAARSWAMANYPDSAFYHLYFIANSDKANFPRFNELQNDEDLSSLHSDKRWREIMDKTYLTAKKNFLSPRKEYGINLTTRDRFEIAGVWALMNNPDSAFAQLNIIAKTKNNIFTRNNSFQTDAILFSLHNDNRWQPVVKEIYKNVAETYLSRVRSGHWTNTTNDRYDAACAFALANEKDSALFNLDKIVNTDYNVYINYTQISNDNSLISLHGDKRWQSLLDAVKKNWLWITTKHSFTGPDIPMIATVDPESKFLKNDGGGSYKNGVDKVISLDQHAYNLQISGHAVWYLSGDHGNLSSRYMILDLNSPVKRSGSVAQGIIKDNDLEFHVLYKMDTTVKPQVVYNFREIPVGDSIESDRTEINFYIKDVLHTLTLGPWGFGRNNEAIAHKGHLNGIGTTKVLVIRHSETSYTIIAPEGSIGRLWKTQNMTWPVDMGLFKTGFIIHLQKQ
ncbi:MAG: hypothetical protein ABIR30_11610 [Chitinophagaceae bacterium]